MKITPKKIQILAKNQVFVFGSNLFGIHGRGAAKDALKWGAQYGNGVGLMGQTYAIPTKDGKLNVLPIETIKKYVDEFIEFAKIHTELIFLVTPIGCGLSNYKPEQISPLFKNCTNSNNVCLPEEFWVHLI